MPNWKTLNNKQWSRQIVIRASKTARLHRKGKEKKGDSIAKQTARLIADHVEDKDIRTTLKELFKAAYKEEWHKGTYNDQ